jgi:hypothetical protein
MHLTTIHSFSFWLWTSLLIDYDAAVPLNLLSLFADSVTPSPSPSPSSVPVIVRALAALAIARPSRRLRRALSSIRERALGSPISTFHLISELTCRVSTYVTETSLV